MSATLPRWDVTDLYPSVAGREFAAALEGVSAGVARLVALYDEHRVGEQPVHAPSAEEVQAFDAVLAATNDVNGDILELQAFVQSFVTTDSRDAAAQAALSHLDQRAATLRQLSARFTAWVAALGPDALAAASLPGADHVFALHRAGARADHQMTPSEESLYAELAVTGSSAWYRLHEDVTSQLTATVARDGGEPEVLPIHAVRALAMHPDVNVRRAAFDAELAAWPTVEVTLAAAMNGIKGEAVIVNRRRQWHDPLDASLFANAVDRPTFEAMEEAVTESLPDFRRFLRAKAGLLGYQGGLRWWDLFAPVKSLPLDWQEGTRVVRDAFATYSGALAGLATRAFDEQWIDAEPRDGKVGGAFCMRLTGDRSLVLLNWSDSVAGVQTLAHELGHAYHNTQLAHRTPLQRQTPMALAETASIFCETLVVASGIAQAASDAERLTLLDTDLQGATGIVVDIHSRLLFESEVFGRRAVRTLSPGELSELMLDAQAAAYGDGLDLETRHPWMWAVKPHYYGSHFYNWPYTYGLLFGLGLFARYQTDPDRFRSGYDDLLSATGMADAAELARRFDIDVRDVSFWRSSLDVVRQRIADYEALAIAATAGATPSA